MIYVSPGVDEPLMQGDIFIGLPRVDLSLGEINLVDENDDIIPTSWGQIAQSGEPVTAVVGIRPVCAIVITQNCDAQHSRDITLCETRPFTEVEAKGREITSAKKWVRVITQQARLNYKWFYLPPDETLGFTNKMCVDFFSTIRVPRADLETFRNCRKRRLNDLATAHFRERIAEFFRRYPYDEWYSLNAEELQAYRSEHPDAQPFPWQPGDSSVVQNPG